MSKPVTLEDSFQLFMKHGEAKATGMSGKNFVKCCKDCKIIDGKLCTTTDADIVFKKQAKGARAINVKTFKLCLLDLAEKRIKEGPKDAIFKMVAGESPAMKGVTKTSKTGGVDKFTDASQYTGSHKERFGADGKGKGLDGREDRAENSGYVGNYKGQGTYEEKTA